MLLLVFLNELLPPFTKSFQTQKKGKIPKFHQYNESWGVLAVILI